MRRFIMFLMGAVSGSVVGAALALLLAPASGDDMRSQFNDRYHQIQDEVEHAAAARRAELEHQLEALRAPRHG